MPIPFPQDNPHGWPGEPPAACPSALSRPLMLQTLLEGFVDGVMVVSLHGEILQANQAARHLCQRLSPDPSHGPPARSSRPLRQVPPPLWNICTALLNHYHALAAPLIPEQDVILGEDIVLRVRLRWFDVIPDPGHPPANHLLITLEDRQQTLHNQAIADMQRYGLTGRETQVWLWRLRGLEYRAIAQKLYISENTVKKHMKSVFAKQRSS